MSDYMPDTDSDVLNWMNAFTTFANANLVPLAIVATDVSTLVTQANSFNVACVNATNLRNQTLAATQAKLAARKIAITAFRNMVRKLQANPNLTDALRRGLGITLRDADPAAAGAVPSQPLYRPVVSIDNSRQLIHRVRFMQESPEPRRAKPAGMNGCEMRIVILPKDAPPPADPLSMPQTGTPTAAPLDVTFAAADAGKVAWYRLRWVNTRNLPVGEWSRPEGAMILA